MARCERCNITFNKRKAENYFDDEMWGFLHYANIKPCLCGECAVEAIRDGDEDVYFETCEKCGRHFDLVKENEIFERFSKYDGIDLRGCWNDQILCAEHALEKVDDEAEAEFESEDYDYDEDIIDEEEWKL